jgi:signal transduction histidine kinase
MGAFRKFTEEVQQLLRREYLEFAKATAAQSAELEDDADPEDVSDSIDETLGEAEAMKAAVAAAQATMSKAVADAEAAADKNDADDEDGVERRRATEALQLAIGKAQATMHDLTEFLSKIEVAQSQNRLLREEIRQMREQLEAGIETMGLGLTAEALSHEMFTIADGLASRTQDIAQGLEDGTLTNAKVRRYVQYARGSVGALRKELAHFSPSLRYVRERRESIDMLGFATEIAEYYSSHWHGRGKNAGIDVTVIDESASPFMVRGNRGKLTQVLDNLLLNSGYWIDVAQKQGVVTDGKITVRLRRPLLVVTDNGPGVEPSVESSLFDAFVTRKPRGAGRGLGLFIVRQLLESESCSIDLGPDRDTDGRRHEFVIDLGGMLDDA